MNFTLPFWQLDAGALVEGFRDRRFTPVDAIDAVIAQSAAWQPAINAFVQLDEAGARTLAERSALRWACGEPIGALDGIPISLKDNLNAAMLATTWGSRLLQGYVPRDDEAMVARLRAAGAVIFGKTNLPEFALQGVTDNELVGPTRNPWDPSLTPGGSSGGAAAAVAAGCGPIALATDGGGSTRRPASHTGIVGFKPSPSLVTRGGGLPEIFLDYESAGLLARTVRDVRTSVGVLAGRDAAWGAAPAAAARILHVPRFADNFVDSGIAQRTGEAAERFRTLGHDVVESLPADWSEEVNALWPAFSSVGLVWMFANASRFDIFAGGKPDIELCAPAARASLQAGSNMTTLALFEALAAIQRLRARMQALFMQYDYILTPATAALPWPVPQAHPSHIEGRIAGPRGHAIFTAFANAAGLPAIALPCGMAQGLPVGVQLVGRPDADASLLALAQQYEDRFPWASRWPALPVDRSPS